MYFTYGTAETEYLKKKDKKMSWAIEAIGHINRETDDDLFTSVIHQIIGQQISTKAQKSICAKLDESVKDINAKSICALGRDKLQSFGITFKKADCILQFAEKVKDGSFDINALYKMTDEEARKKLCSLKGVGVWTAEMIMLFCMQRKDIFSFNDLAIQRGLKMLYGHREITKALFEKYRNLFSPYGSVASLYLWAIAGGAIPSLTVPK